MVLFGVVLVQPSRAMVLSPSYSMSKSAVSWTVMVKVYGANIVMSELLRGVLNRCLDSSPSKLAGFHSQSRSRNSRKVL